MRKLALYNLYKKFLKKYQPYYNIFFLTQLFDITKDHKFYNAYEIKERWQKYIQAIKDKQIFSDMNFYIHMPYCSFKCEYCMYYSKIEIAKSYDLERYVNRLIKQMKFFKDTFSAYEFKSLYIGGGTPSIFSVGQINRLLYNLFSSFKFQKKGEKTYECNPLTIDNEKLRLIKEYGFNRVSFGVESLDKRVLRFANRDYQNYAFIEKAVKSAHSFGFEVNVDIMAGLKGESEDSIIESFMKLTKLRPFSITIYPHKPSERYLNKHFAGNFELFVNNLFKKMAKVLKLLKINSDKSKYYIDPEIDQGDEVVFTSEPTFYRENCTPEDKYRYDFNRLRPCSLFSLGSAACSYIFNSLRYKDISTGKEESEFNPKERFYSAVDFNLIDEVKYYILQTLSYKWCISQGNFSKFFDFFKLRLSDVLKSELAVLKKIGKIRFDGDRIFFPKNPLERYASGLLFFDKRVVLNKISCFSSKNILRLIINENELFIKIEKVKTGKKYYFHNKRLGFYFINNSNGTLVLSELEKQVISAVCRLFKMIASENKSIGPKQMRDSIFTNINKTLDYSKESLRRNGIDIIISIDPPLAKNEAFLF